jgi:GNAT superfamily N-acetyltransferase
MSSLDEGDSLSSSNTALLTPASEAPSEPSQPANPLDGVPDLNTFLAESEADRIEALKLIADSVAQQKQVASRMLMSHPVNVAIFGLLIAVVGQQLYKGPDDVAVLLTTFTGMTVAALAFVRWLTGPYVLLAEKIITWEWLDEDTIIATRYGDKIISALVLGWDPPSSEKSRGRRKKGGKGVIRGWCVVPRYRGRGEGQALLEEAAAVTQKRGGDGLEFEDAGICKCIFFIWCVFLKSFR